MSARILTPDGMITSIRVAWKDGERDVFVWRCDGDATAHLWDTPAEAAAWIAEVWAGPLTARDRQDRDAWVVEEV